MQNQIHTLMPNGENIIISEAFGYSSRGIPGLEIVGLGKRARVFKEKINFITRKFGLKIEAKRFVLCVVDESIDRLEPSSLQYLELPLMLLYWSLGGAINIHNLEDCICGGRVAANGSVKTLENYLDKTSYTMITSKDSHILNGEKSISLADILPTVSRWEISSLSCKG